MTVINICLVDNQEISECMWITCHPPKVCQRINDIGSAVKEDDLKMSEDSFTVKILPEICWLPAVTGPCSKVKILWYYNSLTHRCERFSFSGCGNANHFYSRKECEETCSVNEIFQ
ncbi:Kunitz-type serine protease [Dirofilaria immitis]